MLSAAQIEERRLGIGGSDAGAILGVDPWKTRLQIYLEKIGEAPPDTRSEAADLGNDLEPWVAEQFQRRTGLEVYQPDCAFEHPRYSWMRANVDRLIRGRRAGLECKAIGQTSFLSLEVRQAWEEGRIPAEKRAQCNHYMAVLGCDEWFLAALIGGLGYRIYRLRRSTSAEAELIEAETAFWFDHVEKREPPEIDGSEMARRWLDRRHKTLGPELLEATPEIEWRAERLRRLRLSLKRLGAMESTLDNWFRALIDRAPGLQGQFGKCSYERNAIGIRSLRFTWRKDRDV